MTNDQRTLQKQARQRTYISAISEGIRPNQAAVLAEVTPETVSRWRESDPEFLQRETDALRSSVEAVEAVLYEKALNGSESAARFWLEHHDKDRYGKTSKVEVSGTVTHELSGRRLADQLLALRSELQGRQELVNAPDELPERVDVHRD